MPLERIDEEWTTSPTAPPSAPSHQPGKPLGDDVPTYKEDKRPLARRGAWRIGEPEIGPGKMPTGERIAPWLPKGARKYAALLFAATVALGIFLGGKLAPVLKPLLGAGEEQRVTVLVRTVPSGAKVKLNDQLLEGVTPLAADVPLGEGEHKVQMILEGQGEPVAKTFELRRGQAFASVEAILLDEGVVDVQTRPKGAALFLDGKEVGKSPAELKVPYGEDHELEARLSGYDNGKVTLLRDRPQKHEVRLVLQKKGARGEVVLLSNPTAEVTLDGRVIGQTSLDPRKLPLGEHDVVLRVPSLGVEVSYRIDVPEKGTGKYYFDLSAGGQ